MVQTSPPSNFRTCGSPQVYLSIPATTRSPRQPPMGFASLWICLFWTVLVTGIIGCVVFCIIWYFHLVGVFDTCACCVYHYLFFFITEQRDIEIAKKHMKRHSTLLDTKEKQTKTNMRYYIPKWLKLKTQTILSIDEDIEQLELSYISGWSVKW